MIPFSIINKASRKVVGQTTYLNLDPENQRLEIGGTWLGGSTQKTGINIEAKRLLISHAFENLDCNAVEFRTHIMNQQSRRGIERLGAKLDGILRNHMIMNDGTLRDTCVYSIIQSEWLAVKSNLIYLTGGFAN
jgi:RimJ/RimL family protein N-acetyltransferase